jgi:Domain of unknown function (DUF2017)
MEIRTTDDGWVFEDMDPLIVDLLRSLPASAAPDDDAARKRIFGSLTGGADPQADSEWREDVEPELHELFQSHLDVVSSDLATIQVEDDEFTLKIAFENGRAWIHTLNQARLALGARHGVTEDDTAGRRRHSGAKRFAIMQIDFYGMLLSLLLAHTEI